MENNKILFLLTKIFVKENENSLKNIDFQIINKNFNQKKIINNNYNFYIFCEEINDENINVYHRIIKLMTIYPKIKSVKYHNNFIFSEKSIDFQNDYYNYDDIKTLMISFFKFCFIKNTDILDIDNVFIYTICSYLNKKRKSASIINKTDISNDILKYYDYVFVINPEHVKLIKNINSNIKIIAFINENNNAWNSVLNLINFIFVPSFNLKNNLEKKGFFSYILNYVPFIKFNKKLNKKTKKTINYLIFKSHINDDTEKTLNYIIEKYPDKKFYIYDDKQSENHKNLLKILYKTEKIINFNGIIDKYIINCIYMRKIIFSPSNKLKKLQIFYDNTEKLCKNIDKNVFKIKHYVYNDFIKTRNIENFVNGLKNIIYFPDNKEKYDFNIKFCGSLSPETYYNDSLTWGDYHMALILRKYFILNKKKVSIILEKDWYSDLLNHKNTLFLYGTHKYILNNRNNNILLFISHPENFHPHYFNNFNKIFICSQWFRENIIKKHPQIYSKSIFCLQPVNFYLINYYKNKNKNIKREGIIFVGNNTKKRNCVEWLNNNNRNKVKIFGSKWGKNIEKINTEEERYDLYTKTKKILCDHWDEMKKMGFINDRFIQILACDSIPISDYVKGMDEFIDKKYCFENENQLNMLINNNPNKIMLKKNLEKISTELIVNSICG